MCFKLKRTQKYIVWNALLEFAQMITLTQNFLVNFWSFNGFVYNKDSLIVFGLYLKVKWSYTKIKKNKVLLLQTL